MSNPLKSIMSVPQQTNNPMVMMAQLMSSPNKEQTAMQMLQQVNPQAYQMIRSGVSPQQFMQQFGITQQQVDQLKNQFR